MDYFEEYGWDYSISVTNDNWKRPVTERVKAYLEEADWSETGTHEAAALTRYRPSGWTREQTFAVVARHARQMVVKVSRFTWRVDWFMYVGYGMRPARYRLE